MFVRRTDGEVQETIDENVSLTDVIKRLPVVETSAKAKSVHLVLGKGSQLRVSHSIFCSLAENLSL